jgi:hypothetical protein
MQDSSRPQYRLRTLFVYTLVIAFGLAVLSNARINDADNMFLLSAFFVLPMLALPSLWERAIDAKLPLRFGAFLGRFQLLAVSFFSSAAFMLSTFAFAPQWKGSKGPSWLFYINDDIAAVVLYPFYIGGAIAFGNAVVKPQQAVKSPVVLAAMTINVLISLLYVVYVLVMRYVRADQQLFLLIPGNAAMAYFLMTIAVWRRRELTSNRRPWGWMYGWCGGFLLAMLAKVPLAMRFYASLPDEPPQSCFVVTAAARGHARIVGTSYDSTLCRPVNQQLLRFWQFEELLADQSPRVHRSLRHVYNRIGPLLAKLIIARWQADLVFLLLKPLEWVAVMVIRARG